MELTKCKKFSGCKLKNSESNTGVRRQLSPEFGCIERMCKTMRKVTFAFDGWYIDSLLRTSEFLCRPVYWRRKTTILFEPWGKCSWNYFGQAAHTRFIHVSCLLCYISQWRNWKIKEVYPCCLNKQYFKSSNNFVVKYFRISELFWLWEGHKIWENVPHVLTFTQ